MKIHIGSENELKVRAVRNALSLYPALFPEFELVPMKVPLELFGHPASLDATISGAVERAKAAFGVCSYSIGVEGGLLEAPAAQTGHFEIEVCAIYDGSRLSLGLSSGFEWPPEVTGMIVRGEADASQAFRQLGLTPEEKLGAVEGGILGVLTHGRMTRERQIEQAVITAMIRIERAELY